VVLWAIAIGVVWTWLMFFAGYAWGALMCEKSRK
jgi:hypothetical protein